MAAIPEVKTYKDENGNPKYIGVTVAVFGHKDAYDTKLPNIWQLWNLNGKLETWGTRQFRSQALASMYQAARHRIKKEKRNE